MGWHELTGCYGATCWTVSNRTLHVVQSPACGEWYFVEAVLRNDGGQTALLIYSIFDGAGNPKLPAELQGYIPGHALSAEEKRCLQCQVMLPHQKELSSTQLDQVRELHVQTRERFRSEWLRQQLATHSP